MKKSLLFAAILIAGFVVSSCSNDEVNQDSLTTRSYDKDAEILSKFVSINKARGEYFINDAKKVTALSYITDQDWKELQKVSPVNKTKYENELKALNVILAAAAQRGDVSQIVYATNDETWIRNVNEGTVNIEKGNILETRATRGLAGQLSFMGGGYTGYSNFSAGRRLKSRIEVTLTSFNSYYFEIGCTTGTKQGPLEGGTNPNKIIMSGSTHHFIDENYIWTTSQSGDYVNWDFQGTLYSPSTDYTASVRVDFFDY